MKCPECFIEFDGETTNEYINCPSCGKKINTNQAVKYYNSLKRIENEDRKIAEGEKYQKLNALLDECQWLIDNEDFDSALNTTDLALELSNTDGRVYLMRVYAKTKNFTDFEETSHFSDLKKAIEYSSTFEKENVKKIYAPYHKKRNVPKEELEEYESQEADSKLSRVEILLKDGIPKHFAREKSIKTLIPLTICFSVAFLALLILSLIFSNVYLSISTAVAFTLSFILFANLNSNVKKVKLFNSALDVFDNIKNCNLLSHTKLNLSKSLEKFAISFLNGESLINVEASIFEIMDILLKSDLAIEFMKKDTTFGKYI